MPNQHLLLTLTLVLFSTLILAGCENYAEKTHPSWVAPPAGAVFDDSTIYARIAQAVQTDPDLRGINIDIKVKDGNVTLFGTASNENQVTRINMHAWIADGVKKVDNQIVIQ
ncbi:MAG: transporter [Proteobacteria bacterium SG_bin4]|nr:MAG: transporter [Proteobacteria bacterium SG_bin4]